MDVLFKRNFLIIYLSIKKIIKNKDLPENQSIETYTGISYVDLGRLTKTPGVSKFFESVCPIDKINIPAILLENVDYWDFGTVKRYWETCFNILNTYKTRSTHPFLRFLVQEKALKTWKIDLQNTSYHSKSPRVINLNSDEEIKELNPSIIISGKNVSKTFGMNLWWNDLVEEVK